MWGLGIFFQKIINVYTPLLGELEYVYVHYAYSTYPQILWNMYRNTSVPYINVFRYNINRILTNIMPLFIKPPLSKYKIQINLHFLGRDILDKSWKIFNRPVGNRL